PHEHCVQLRVSTTLPVNVCFTGKLMGQGKSLATHTQSPATKGAAGVGAQICPPGHPPPSPPPTQAMPARDHWASGFVLPPPPGVHAPANPVGAAAWYAFVLAAGWMGPHCAGGGCTAVPVPFAHAASSLHVSACGMQLTAGVLQVQAAHTAGWG